MRLTNGSVDALDLYVKTKFTEPQLLRNLLHGGINPTFIDILYNIFLCISQGNKQHWC